MKKILSIALIAALVVASAFAGFGESYATLDLGFDLDSKTYGFVNKNQVKYSMSFELGADAAEKSGEADLRAAIAAEFGANIKVADTAVSFDTVTLKITKADILYKDFVRVGILDAGSSSTYATAYYPVDETKPVSSTNKLVDAISGVSGVDGFNFTVYGVEGGFGFTGNADTEKYNVLAHAATTVNVSDVAVDVAAGTLLTDADKTFVAAAKATFEKDKISAKAALDFQVKNEKAGVEFAANAKYSPVTVDVYFVSLDSFETVKLDAKVAAVLPVEPVTLTAYADARDITVEGRELGLGLNAKAVVDKFTLVGDVKAKVLVAKDVTVSADATYNAGAYTANAKLTVGMNYADDFKVTSIAPEVSVSSDKVIDGATVSLGWTGAEFADAAAEKANGKINAQVKISL